MAQFQTMASAAASHLVNQQQQQQQFHQQTSAAVAAQQQQQQQHLQQQPMMQPTMGPGGPVDLSGMPTGLVGTNPAMAMAANAIVAGGQQQSAVRRVVKWVFSGDYLVLRDYPRGGPPPEYYINLAYVQAPRFNRTPGEDGKTSVSEPYAWEAKDYLARRLIGREVFYQSEYTKSGGAQPNAAGGPFGSNANKEFGIIYLGDENIVKTMVSEGLLEVRRSKGESPMLQQLIEAEEEAKQAGRGRFSSQPAPKHELLHEHPNPNSLKGKSFNGTVENVRNGGAIQVYLDLGAEQGVHKHLNASVMVTGIRSPDKNRPNESKFFDEAKFFTESRLLNREVKVHVEKIERNSYLASVVLGQNNLAEALLRQGMARCNDASITLTKAPEKLRAAEKEAKSKRLRIWENYVDSRGDGPAEAYEAKIIEIISGDSMMAQNLATGEVKKIFLASIRLGAPADRERQREAAREESATATETAKPAKGEKNKSGTAQQQQQATTEPSKTSSIPRIYDNPILYHAREMLRKKLLGKKALVKVEYIQPKSDSYPEKICCTVRPADQPKWNAAEALVGKGYASVVKYVSDDSQRASNFDELLKIEQNAVKPKDSKDKQKELAPLRVVDLCNDANRAKQLFPFLSRTRKDAVIEFVFSASRFKVFLPKENNTLLNLVLAGVMVPREPEALKNASTAAAKSLVHQRDVSIQIDSMDKKGNFIGWIYYKDEQTNKETSINMTLVKLGYGQVRDSSASGTLGDLKAAESIAREKKLGLWLTYQEPKRREEEASSVQDDIAEGGDEENAGATTNGVSSTNKSANKEAELMKNRKPVVVTNAQMKEKNVIVSLQAVENGPKLEELLRQMRSELPQAGKKGGSGEGYTPTQKGEIVAAKFSADRQWYRAKVLKVNSPQDIEILFIDYGNVEKAKAKDLVKLASKYATPEAYAKDYTLAFVEATTHDLDWVEESRRAFLELSFGQVLMRVEYNDPTTKLDAVTLVNESTKIDVGKKLVEDGLLIAMKRRERKFVRTINEYINAEKLAKEKRSNMWQYGDFTADDAREFGFRSAAA
uniref:Nuclease domain-containing protein 1 n=1 Tax=Aceria tosichella TaxID=561515 RepID=A0A6G1S696_9ACAR